jgi:hypothetical protein
MDISGSRRYAVHYAACREKCAGVIAGGTVIFLKTFVWSSVALILFFILYYLYYQWHH